MKRLFAPILMLALCSLPAQGGTAVYLKNETDRQISMPEEMRHPFDVMLPGESEFYTPVVQPGEKKLLFRVSRLGNEKKEVELQAARGATTGTITVSVTTKQKGLKNNISYEVKISSKLSKKLKYEGKHFYKVGYVFKDILITIRKK